MSEESIKLTGTTLTLIALHIDHLSSNLLFEQLKEKIQQAPQFFHQSPIIIDLGNISPENITIDLIQLVDHCRSLGIQPIAFKNVNPNLNTQQLTLPTLTSTGKDKSINLEGPPSTPTTETPAPKAETVITETIIEEKLITRKSKIITRPIRSGQQVYAEDADLIILAQVSEGAEVIADGNIHVYGALRGRALAGVKGDAKARIFCQQMNAELVAIAGEFLLSDSMDACLKDQAVQIVLSDERLLIKPLK